MRFNHMKFSTTEQEKGVLVIQVTAWAGFTAWILQPTMQVFTVNK